jgi:hypothetical protein
MPSYKHRKKAYRPRALKPQQRDFILAYISNGHNYTQAAITAGYPPKNAGYLGWQLANLVGPVVEEIKRLEDLAYKKNGITAEYILGGLKQIAEDCRAKRVETDPETGELKCKGVVDSAGANRAMELLGKNRRLFIDTLEIRRDEELDGLSDEELAKVVLEGEKRQKRKKKSKE